MGIRHRIRMSRASICLIVAGALIAQAGVALFAVAAVGAQTLPGSVTPAKANAATGYDYVNLGDNFESESLNNSDVVAGNINNDLDQLGVWKNGITTPLKTAPLPAGSSGGASANAVLANGAVIHLRVTAEHGRAVGVGYLYRVLMATGVVLLLPPELVART